MTNNATATNATAPLVGAALLDLVEAMRGQGATAKAIAAGYGPAPGRTTPQFTAFYEAQLAARNGATGCSGWHHRIRSPFALVVLQDAATGEPVPFASLPIAASHAGHTSAEDWSAALDWIEENRHAIAGANHGHDTQARLIDRDGSQPFATISGTGRVDLCPVWVVCDRCGAIEWSENASTVDGEPWCESCANDHASTCDCCGDTFPTEDLQRVAGGDCVCSGCIESRFSWCHHCEEWHPDTDMRHLYDREANRVEDACVDCISYHTERGEWSHDRDGDARNCERWEYDSHDDDDDDEPQGPGGMTRHRYHTEPHGRLNVDPLPTGHAWGVELEYLGNPHHWEAIAATCRGQAILTDDGSVAGEFVTRAMGAGEMRRFLPALAGALTGSRNDSRTGLHIHTDRRQLTPWQWYRLAHYCQQHSATLAVVSGRRGNDYQCWERLQFDDWQEFVRLWKNGGNESRRYVGVRFTSKTVEFRCNRATKTPARALARFSMVQRLVAIGKLPDSAKPNSAELQGWLAQCPYIRAETGWAVGPWGMAEALKVQPVAADLPPWMQPNAERQARILQLSIEANRRAIRHLSTAEDAAWEHRHRNTEPRTPAHLQALTQERSLQWMRGQIRENMERQYEQLAQLLPLT